MCVQSLRPNARGDSKPNDLLARFDELLKRFPPEADPLYFPARSWERLRYQGMLLKDYVVKDLPIDIPFASLARETLWHAFKSHCAAAGNRLPWLIYYLEPQRPGMFERKCPRRQKGELLFDDLPPAERAEAQETFDKLWQEWSWRVRIGTAPSGTWRKPILVGVARRLARNPSNRSSEWGRRLRRIKGGKHAQQRYKERGWHPLASVRKAWGLRAEQPKE